MGRSICISVIGTSSATKEEARVAQEVGRQIAEQGAVLICGGLGGVMEAVSRGAKEAGGITVGILPGEDPTSANPYIDIPIVTGLGFARNVIVASSGDAVIAVGGKLGTLTEIAFALMKGIPVIGIGTWALEKERLDGHGVIIARDAREAVEKAFQMIRSSARIK